MAGWEFEVGSSGGTVATRYATARLVFDELVYETVALALIEVTDAHSGELLWGFHQSN